MEVSISTRSESQNRTRFCERQRRMTEPECGSGSKSTREGRRRGGGGGKASIVMICGSLVYYHCAYRNSSIVSLVSDVFIVLLCSLAILGLLFRHIKIEYDYQQMPWVFEYSCAFY